MLLADGNGGILEIITSTPVAAATESSTISANLVKDFTEKSMDGDFWKFFWGFLWIMAVIFTVWFIKIIYPKSKNTKKVK